MERVNETVETGACDVSEIANLSTCALAELKKNVDAEVAKRLEDLRSLMPAPKKRNRSKK